MLWGRSGNRCAFPGCRKVLVEGETETDDASIVGDAAHIIAESPDGPRGISQLTAEERDKNDNLILLCKAHHKIVDDQFHTYTVEVLRQYKYDHVEWVDKNLSMDVKKQKDDEIYAMYIDQWIELADINNWQAWTSWTFGSGQPRITKSQYDKLQQLNEYILCRVWPHRYLALEDAFNNFRLILNDFLKVFSEHMEKIGRDDDPWYNTEKFYKRLERWDSEAYRKLSDEFDYHVALVLDLMAELTRAGNYLCDQIRQFISHAFRIQEGLLLVTIGPTISLAFETYRLEYKSEDKIEYPGLRKFMEIRGQRTLHFGCGVNECYF